MSFIVNFHLFLQCRENGGRHQKSSKVTDMRQRPCLIQMLVSIIYGGGFNLAMLCLVSDETEGKK